MRRPDPFEWIPWVLFAAVVVAMLAPCVMFWPHDF